MRTVKRYISALSSLWDEVIPRGEATEPRPMWLRSDLARLFKTPILDGLQIRAPAIHFGDRDHSRRKILASIDRCVFRRPLGRDLPAACRGRSRGRGRLAYLYQHEAAASAEEQIRRAPSANRRDDARAYMETN
jgi:hypothetical protein